MMAPVPPSRIAFGSCNNQDLQNNLWPVIEKRKPAGFIWGGDSIYAGKSIRVIADKAAGMLNEESFLSQTRSGRPIGVRSPLPLGALSALTAIVSGDCTRSNRRFQATKDSWIQTLLSLVPLMVRSQPIKSKT
jgi:hypothetical protein